MVEDLPEFYEGLAHTVRAGFIKRHGTEPTTRRDMHLGFVEEAACALLGPRINGGFDYTASITDGPHDIGLDAIAILVGRQLVTTPDELKAAMSHSLAPDCQINLIQITTSQRLRQDKVFRFVDGALDFLSVKSTKRSHKGIQNYRALKEQLLNLCQEKAIATPHITLNYACMGSNGPVEDLTTRVNEIINQYDNLDQYSAIEFKLIDALTMSDMQEAYDRRRSGSLDAQYLHPLPKSGDIGSTYLGVTTLTDFYSLIGQHEDGRFVFDPSVFAENVRNDLGEDSRIQKSIRKTLESSDIEHLPVLHSGVTIVCTNCIREDGRLIIHDYQIVDGCQTSMALIRSRDKLHDANAFIKITVAPATERKLRDKIVLTTNSQAPVTEEQKLSLIAANRAINRYFAIKRESNAGPNLVYDLRQGQYEDDPTILDNSGTLDNPAQPSKIKAYDLYKAYASMFHAVPHLASKGIHTIKQKMYDDLARETPQGVHPYYCAGVANYWVGQALKEMSPDLRSMRYQILYAATCLMHPSSDRTLHQDRMQVATSLIEALENPQPRKAMLEQIEVAIRATVDSVSRWHLDDRETPRNPQFTDALTDRLRQHFAQTVS